MMTHSIPHLESPIAQTGEHPWHRTFGMAAFKKVFAPNVAIFDEKSTTNRYSLLDLLRFAACLMVILFHYRHFYYVHTHVLPANWICSDQPLFSLFFPAYLYGDKGVQVFWALSGFVFTALFSRKIHDGKLSAFQFATDRFSRLYPLHLLSLLLVSLLVWGCRSWMGYDGIYRINDWHHFFLNLFFVPSILPNKGLSFNGPAWSVSLELLAYVVFFLCARFWKLSFLKTCCIAVLFAWLRPWPESFPCSGKVNQCIFFFFAGGSVFLALRTFSERIHYVFAYMILLVAGVAVACVFKKTEFWILCLVFAFSFPAAIPEPLARICTRLGDLSYAIYMLHVPLQLSLMLGASMACGEKTVELAGSPWFFIGYVVLLLVVACVTYHFFELPVKKRLRAWMTPCRI